MSIALSPAQTSSLHPVPAIEMRGVHLRLGSAGGLVHILRGIDLAVEQGETIGLVGPSGSGKTSLLMVIAGLEEATEGSVKAAGMEITQLNEDGLADFRRAHVGIVFQNFHLVPTMTAIENAALPIELAGGNDAFSRAEAALVAVGLGHRLHHYPSQLSGGEQQRVALARAFAPEPTLLLADEPTGNLDGATGAEIIDLLFDLQRRRATTLLLITHDPALAARCERIVELKDGAIIGDRASPREVTRAQAAL
ncbi:MAG: ABC transporter ATP-binding protein [Rhodospirillales bacterium]|nr:ABC transporter ATP-binding protein [Rhodospirillales bacterium]